MPTTLTLAIDSLFEGQQKEWNLVRDNYTSLQNVSLKAISFDGFVVRAQFNPKRIISSSAKIDSQSISSRPCFLCDKNRPPQQQGIIYQGDYILLVNPYPVFRQHLTVPSILHQPQRIRGNFGMMLLLAKDLPGFSIIYNGPKCGASAPDHFHFQAIQKGVLPIESDFTAERCCLLQGESNGTALFSWHNYLRKPITIRGSNTTALEDLFNRLYILLGAGVPLEEEPMMNILAAYDHDHWVVHIFPRKQHRPRQYFETGSNKILISPASIDMGGVLIMPREEDYHKITAEVIADIFRQVCEDDLLIQYLVQKLI